MAVKFLVTAHISILIMPDENSEHDEIGWNDVQFGDIDAILDALPDE